MLTIIGIVVACGIAGLFVLLAWGGKIAERNGATLSAAKASLIERYGDGDYHLTMPGPQCLGLAWNREEVIVGKASSPTSIPFAALRDVAIETDGVNVTNTRTTTKTNRGSQLAGGLMGGAVMGPVGLLAGGLSGSTTATAKAVETKKLKSMKMVIRVADRATPLHKFVFFDYGFGDGYAASHPIIAPALERAAHYDALLKQVIGDQSAHRQADGSARVLTP
jgi:hypothetical protein